MGDFDALYDTLSQDPCQRGREFELMCQFILQHDPAFAPRLRQVWLWKAWPGRWSDLDAGIDLVAEDVGGQLWAIQAKAYAEHRRVTKRDVDTFLAESARAEFSCRVLITSSAAGLQPIAANVVAAQEKPVIIVDRQALRASPVDWPDGVGDLEALAGTETVGKTRLPENIELLLTSTEDFVAAMCVQDHGSDRWAQWFSVLERYVAEFGHARPPADCRFEGQSLGRWVIHQRHRWARGKLSPARVERLQRLPGWTFSVHEAFWIENYHQLAKFVSTHGSPSVPLDFRAANGKSLAAWIVNQRSRYAQGKLPEHRVRLLEALPGWTWASDGDSGPRRIRRSRPAET